jgi:hypothetical protein
MAPAFLFKLGAQDLSQYVRVSPQDSLDPYGGGDWADPQFSDAPFAEGRPLLNIDTNNREMVWPLFLKGVASGGSSYSSTVLADSPALYWRLGESAGATAADASGNGRTGAYGSGVTKGTAGALSGDADTAVTLDDTVNGKVTSTYSPFTGNFTIEGWAKRTDTLTEDVLFASSAVNYVSLTLTAASNDVVFDPNSSGGGVDTWAGAWPGTGTWVHWALTYTAAGTVAELFINGVSQGTRNTDVGAMTNTAFVVGWHPGDGAGFKGSVDEVAVYSSVLSSARILAHYQVGAGVGTATAKDSLHTIVQQIVREINNPTSTPLRVEWKDQGASNSTFYDVTYARWDPHFNYRLSEHAYADGAVRVWCQPPYGHTATERIIATAAGTAPGLIASLIGVASPLVGDVAPQLRVTVNTSGEAVGPAGRGVIVSAPAASGYLPFISAASFAAPHPSAVLLGASGAPGSQALFNQGPADSGPIARLGLGATMYAGRNRVFAAVLPRTYTPQAVWAGDTYRQPLGPTAVSQRPDGFRILDLGVVNVPTSTPTTEVGLYGGPVVQTASDGFFQKPAASGAQGSSMLGIAGIYVLPENNTQAVRDLAAKPLTRSFFGASGAATALIDQLIGDYAETWYHLPGGAASTFYGVNGMHLYPNGDFIWGNVNPVRDFRMRGIVHPFCTPGFGPGNGIVQFGIAPKGQGQGEYLYAAMMTQNASLMALSVRSSGVGHLATLVIASAAGFPLASTLNGLVIDLWRQDSKVTLNAQWATGTGISYIPSAGMTATTVPVASTGVTDARLRTVGVPIVFANATIGISYLQYDELRNMPQPSEAYRLTSVSGDTSLRSPVTGSGPNVDLSGAKIAPALTLSPSSVGIVTVDWQQDGGPMNDPNGVEVRVRERFTYAR